MANESTLSLPEIEDRIAILRDNIRQLTEQAAAASGAGSEALIADRIAEQDAELQRLIAERDALLKKRAASAPKVAVRNANKKAPKKKAANKKKVAKKKKAAKKTPAKRAKKKAAKKKAKTRR